MGYFPVLCIAISTYNRAEKIESQIKEILKCRSKKFSVVVVDDNSEDDTLERLLKIKDTRLTVVSNKENLGAIPNWYETIEQGNGKYILHHLDRDKFNVQYINQLIDILEYSSAAFGYVGNSLFSAALRQKVDTGVVKNFCSGLEASEVFAFTAVHPSGFLVKKSIWCQLSDKKKFFCDSCYGIYPHSYIYAMLALKYNGILINYKITDINDVYLYKKYSSKFYKKSKMKFYWTPEAQWKELMALTNYINDHEAVWHLYKFQILKKRFQEKVELATILYRKTVIDVGIMAHYGVKPQYVNIKRLLKINWSFAIYYSYMLLQQKNYRFILINSIFRICLKNMFKILSYE